MFAVSDEPEIHSNGFHIKFDRKQLLGMITPIWIEDTAEWYGGGGGGEECETVMRIKLRDNIPYPRLRSKLKPSCDHRLLLFLRKIECMEYSETKSRGSTETKRNRKTRLSQNWIRLETTSVSSGKDTGSGAVAVAGTDAGQDAGGGTSSTATGEAPQLWFIKTDTFHPTYKRAPGGNSELAQSDADKAILTEVAIAFKFQQIKGPDGATVLQLDLDQRMPLYAFLPTEMNIFRFIVQADFTLVAARDKFYKVTLLRVLYFFSNSW